ncbi:unnamed protein product, partial [Laminaria digitata]
MLGWEEFYQWGQGPVGQVLLSPLSASSGGGGGGGGGGGYGEGYLSTDPKRGGVGFALLLLYPLSLTVAEVWLSALKYLANLLELRKEAKHAQSYGDEGSMEAIAFFTRLGQAILSAGRTFYMFQSCGHCTLTRKMVIRTITIFNGAQAVDQIHRAAWRVLLAREIEVAFPDASEKELQRMTPDESCAICLKVMTSAKRLDCQHFFHTACLRQFLNNCAGAEPLCPICRAPVPWHPASGIKSSRGTTTTTPTTTTNNNTTTNSTSSTSGAAASNRTGPGLGPHDPFSSSSSRPDRPLPASERTLGGFGGANVVGPPTPDSFSRAARGADAAVRLFRRALAAVRAAQTFRNNFDAAVADAVPPPRSAGPATANSNARGEHGRAPRGGTTIFEVDGEDDDDDGDGDVSQMPP